MHSLRAEAALALRIGASPAVGVDHFPSPAAGNRYSVAKCCTWLEGSIAAWKANPELTPTEEIKCEAKARLESARAAREERKQTPEAETVVTASLARADPLGIIDRSWPADCRTETFFCACEAARNLGLAPEVVAIS